MEISTPLGAERMRRNYEIFIRSPESGAERARMAEQIRQQLEAKGYGFEPLLTDDEYSELGRDASVVGDRLGLLTVVRTHQFANLMLFGVSIDTGDYTG